MNKMNVYFVAMLFLGSIAFIACSDNSAADRKKGGITEITDIAAEEAVSRIRRPLDRARSAAVPRDDNARQ